VSAIPQTEVRELRCREEGTGGSGRAIRP